MNSILKLENILKLNELQMMICCVIFESFYLWLRNYKDETKNFTYIIISKYNSL